ncbi:hypothetical protein SAMN05428960_1418 [Mitsuaria sp. PDC51]|uniref:hypothetical protein n=1 Tax=Mitsuaria sp. PDC51 TaxID=1881035 RepID=UPI0008EDEFDD|nr:hypothetical protein [Mitsuaria sp. PDC51]SFR77255.1 hypothetical protein SAMN05428960_1418 [Mitsuaria sp. PDC51]
MSALGPFQRHPQFANGTFFEADPLAGVEALYRWCDERFGTTWRTGRSSILARDWNEGFEPAVKRLLFIAYAIERYVANLTTESTPAIDHKIPTFLKCNSVTQFREDLGELVIGGIIGDKAGPVACDPLVRPLTFSGDSGATRPNSCDFAIRMPNDDGEPTDILVDVTTLNFGHYRDWQKALDEVANSISNQIIKAGLFKQLSFSASLGITAHSPFRRDVLSLIEEMRDSADGRKVLSLPGGEVEVAWEGMDIIQIEPDEFPTGNFRGRAAVFHTAGAVAHSSVSVNRTLRPAATDEAIIYKSLIRTLKAKKEQLKFLDKETTETAIFIQNASEVIPDAYLEWLLHTRVWPNPEFRWLSCVSIFRITEDYSTRNRAVVIAIITNPNAHHKTPQSFLNAMTTEVTYRGGIVQPTPPSETLLAASPPSSS